MFKEPYSLVDLTRHTDPRGSLFEILRFKDWKVPGEGYIYTFTINPGQRRGDHYHTRKLEWFTCAHGRATILIEEQNGKKEKVILDAEKPSVLFFAPYTAHTLINESNEIAVIVSYGSKQHDPSDPDTVSKIITL